MTTVVQVAFIHTHRHRTPPPVGWSVDYMDFKGVGRSIIQSSPSTTVWVPVGLFNWNWRSTRVVWYLAGRWSWRLGCIDPTRSDGGLWYSGPRYPAIQRLKVSFGFTDVAVQWLLSYLVGQSQYVRRGDAKSAIIVLMWSTTGSVFWPHTVHYVT